MNTYIAFYNKREIEIKADTLYNAKTAAINVLAIPKSKQGLLAVVLAEKEGESVIHSTSQF